MGWKLFIKPKINTVTQMMSHRVWGILVKMLRRELSDPKVVEMFYREVIHVLLLFVLDAWFLLAAVERMHTGFLRKITGKRARRKAVGTGFNPKVEVVQEAVGT